MEQKVQKIDTMIILEMEIEQKMNIIMIWEMELEQKIDDINMGDGNGTKDGYNNDIENRASKCNKYRINYNINKNK